MCYIFHNQRYWADSLLVTWKEYQTVLLQISAPSPLSFKILVFLMSLTCWTRIWFYSSQINTFQNTSILCCSKIPLNYKFRFRWETFFCGAWHELGRYLQFYLIYPTIVIKTFSGLSGQPVSEFAVKGMAGNS